MYSKSLSYIASAKSLAGVDANLAGPVVLVAKNVVGLGVVGNLDLDLVEDGAHPGGLVAVPAPTGSIHPGTVDWLGFSKFDGGHLIN